MASTEFVNSPVSPEENGDDNARRRTFLESWFNLRDDTKPFVERLFAGAPAEKDKSERKEIKLAGLMAPYELTPDKHSPEKSSEESKIETSSEQHQPLPERPRNISVPIPEAKPVPASVQPKKFELPGLAEKRAEAKVETPTGKAAELLMHDQAQLEKIQFNELQYDLRHEVKDDQSVYTQVPGTPEGIIRAQSQAQTEADKPIGTPLPPPIPEPTINPIPQITQPEPPPVINTYKQAVIGGAIAAVLILFLLVLLLALIS